MTTISKEDRTECISKSVGLTLIILTVLFAAYVLLLRKPPPDRLTSATSTAESIPRLASFPDIAPGMPSLDDKPEPEAVFTLTMDTDKPAATVGEIAKAMGKYSGSYSVTVTVTPK